MLQQVTKENFGQLMRQFSTAELEELIDKFPYFQQAHLLLAKKYQEENDSRFDRQLQLAALYIADRALLYDIFHEKRSPTAFNPTIFNKQEETIEQAPVVETIEFAATIEANTSINEPTPVLPAPDEEPDTRLEIEEVRTIEYEAQQVAPDDEKVKTEAKEPFSISEPHSFDEWLMAFSSTLTEERAVEVKTDEEKDEELDKIIMENTPVGHLQQLVEDETHYSKGLDQFIEEQIERHKRTEPEAAVNENELAPELITETMAKVYEMQKKYARAIKAYETLALKYPEKSGLFAARINYIKNIS